MCLHLLACMEEMSMSLFFFLWRAEHLSAWFGLYGELSVCLHVSAHIKS
jgi:hypothetical protein